MNTAADYPHLTIDASGVARIENSRYKVQHLAAEHFHHGWTAEELLRQHPDLRPEQVYAALTYFYDHYDSMVSSLEASATVAETTRQRQAISRADLLSRQQPGQP